MSKFYHYEKEKLPQPIFEGGEDWIALYYKAWETLFGNIDDVGQEGWKPMLTCMPGVGKIWQWDSCFMAMITNYANDTFSAMNNLDNLYRLQREDGFIAMCYTIKTESMVGGEKINPPLYAWAEWEHYILSGDRERLAQVLPHLEGLYDYIEKNRRRFNQLYYFEQPGSSGMDNAPRGGGPSYDQMGSDICHIDLACQQALSAKCMAKILRVLGEVEKAEFYEAEQKRINRLINKNHWSPKTGFYYDFFPCGDTEKSAVPNLINSKTSAAFWPMLCGAAEDRKIPYIQHIMNPEEFYTHTPFASLSKDDLNYNPTGGYWLGSSWHPTTFAAIRGLSELGYHEYAREATVKLLNSMSEVMKNPTYGGIWECYSPEESRPAGHKARHIVRANFVGWGGLAPINLFIEQILGLHFNAPENMVLFEVFPDKKSGLRNMLFNGGKVDIECIEYKRPFGQTKIRVAAEKPFTLKVMLSRGRKKIFEVAPGENIFEV